MTDRIDTAKERERLDTLDGRRLYEMGLKLLDALDTERAENERMREALAPFAGAAESAIGVVGKTTTLGVLGAIAVYFVTWRDFTRARATLNPETP